MMNSLMESKVIMKKYFAFVFAGILGSMHPLCGNEKFERALYAVHTQDLSQLKRALFMELKLTPTEFGILIDEATAIYRKFAKELTLFTRKKDAAMFFGGSLLCLVVVLANSPGDLWNIGLALCKK